MAVGIVHLVGAGPGDPKLITVRGLEALKKADVVIHDRLANPKLLEHAKERAQFIYCGKEASNHALSQDEINAAILKHALEGKRVVRLKGGDPYVFGRGGEEAEACVEAGVPFEIIPGITSGIAAPAYAGIPVTHRNFSSSFAVVTGHACEGNEGIHVDWARISTAVETIVFYMGVRNLPLITKKLLENGRDKNTPVALVRWGTCAVQQTLVGTLDTIVEKVREAKFTSPAIIIVGETVRLHEKLSWYENKPLFGKRVAVLHRGQQAAVEQIEELAGQPVEILLVDTVPASEDTLDTVINQLETSDRMVFSSEEGVGAFFRRIREMGEDIRSFRGGFYAVGRDASEALLNKGLFVETITDNRLNGIWAGEKIIVESEEQGKGSLVHHIREQGAEVIGWTASKKVLSEKGFAILENMIEEQALDYIAFTCPADVHAFVSLPLFKDQGRNLERLKTLCFDEETAALLHQKGVDVDYIVKDGTAVLYSSRLSVIA
ncbi:uroporphyrinogen-III C-methyltransferase [Aneurinibacillus tyrosinisolvens]|uniref:uroporphyrinogen-III C-methyltransferase n=1 Tax=Aneurinibacillus tyrosinisolvens TaxID=1443435 RepID=UPI00063F3D83|nr:uroporphyrinogen-III C-methyltransferase [Aneurinibacillus tyrosinisolvens]